MLSIKADPTFDAPVEIGVPGKEPVKVGFTFKHRTKDELDKFVERSKTLGEVETVMECCAGWALADKFDKKNVGFFVQHYHTAAKAIAKTYLTELMQVARKN